MYVSVGQAARLIGVSASTLRRWEREKKIKSSSRTLGGHRRYLLSKLKEKVGLITDPKTVVAYARVSSHDQKSGFRKTKKRLVEKLKKESSPTELISDLGLGLNYKKRGLSKLIFSILSGKVNKIILTHKDRLLRFGSEIIFLLCEFFGCRWSSSRSQRQTDSRRA